MIPLTLFLKTNSLEILTNELREMDQSGQTSMEVRQESKFGAEVYY